MAGSGCASFSGPGAAGFAGARDSVVKTERVGMRRYPKVEMVVLPRKKFTAEQYHQMAAAGILEPADRVELIEGEIVRMSPVGRQHALCVDGLNDAFGAALRPDALVRVQNPVASSDRSEPDLAILSRSAWLDLTGHPQPQDILALVEVSDTTLAYDREVKAPLYARAGIRELWIVDLDAIAIEVYRAPGPAGYGNLQTVRKAQSVSFQAFPDRLFAARELLARVD